GDGLPRVGIDLPGHPGRRPDGAAAAHVLGAVSHRRHRALRLRLAGPGAADLARVARGGGRRRGPPRRRQRRSRLGGDAARVGAGGALYARGAPLPASPLLSASMQMLAASALLGVAGLARGEAQGIHPDSFSAKPLIAFVYLVLVGSLVAFSAYAWLLKNVRISVVSTYAFVNPVVAVTLGTLFLNEAIGWSTIVAGASIVIAVVLIVTARTPAPKPAV